MPQIKGLSGFTLKLIAIVVMTADHIGWLFVPTYTPLGFVLHLFGRMTAPIMAFFVAEGYHRTRNVWRYLGRLGLFALLAQFPFSYYMLGRFYFFSRASVMFTLFLGLLALIVAKHEKLHLLLKLPLLALILLVAESGDWGAYMVLWVLGFGLLYRRRGYALLWAAGITTYTYAQPLLRAGTFATAWLPNLFNMGGVLALPLLALYDGRPGRVRLKYLFYLYYPAHLLLLRLLYTRLH